MTINSVNVSIVEVDTSCSKSVDLKKSIIALADMFMDAFQLCCISNIGVKIDAVMDSNGIVIPELKIYWEVTSNAYTRDRNTFRKSVGLTAVSGNAKAAEELEAFIKHKIQKINKDELYWGSLILEDIPVRLVDLAERNLLKIVTKEITGEEYLREYSRLFKKSPSVKASRVDTILSM